MSNPGRAPRFKMPPGGVNGGRRETTRYLRKAFDQVLTSGPYKGLTGLEALPLRLLKDMSPASRDLALMVLQMISEGR